MSLNYSLNLKEEEKKSKLENKNNCLSNNNSTSNILSNNFNLIINNLISKEEVELEELNFKEEIITPENNRISTRTLNYSNNNSNNNNNNNNELSPRSLSESSKIMKDVLLVHPTFSVFRKSNSQDSLTEPEEETSTTEKKKSSTLILQSDSNLSSHLINLDEPAASEEMLVAERSFPSLIVEEEGEVEWHLSSGEEMASLHWGEEESITSEHSHSPSNNNNNKNNCIQSTSFIQRRDVTLNQFNSPPPTTHRTSTTSSRTPLHPLVHFSPLSLAPSPLLGLPPPTPHDHQTSPSSSSSSSSIPILTEFHLSHSHSHSNGNNYKAILKKAGTPGTGRSVRFSASTSNNREPTPPSMARFADAGIEIEEEEEGDEEDEDQEEEEEEVVNHYNDSIIEDVHNLEMKKMKKQKKEIQLKVIEEESSKAVTSFLSKLQAAIPSPENSFSNSIDTSSPPPPVSQVAVAVKDQPCVTISSPTSSPTPILVFDDDDDDDDEEEERLTSTSSNNNLFNTSIPHSFLGASVAESLSRSSSSRLGIGMESKPILPLSIFTTLSSSLHPLSSSSSINSLVVINPNINNSSTTTTPTTPITQINEVLEDLHSVLETTSSSSSVITPQSQSQQQQSNSSSFYRQFLQKRAPTSTIATEKLSQLINHNVNNSLEGEELDDSSAIETIKEVEVEVETEEEVELEELENSTDSSEDSVIASLTYENIPMFGTLHDALSPIYEESEENTTFNSTSPSPSPVPSPLKSRYTTSSFTPVQLLEKSSLTSINKNTKLVVSSPLQSAIVSSPNYFARNITDPTLLDALLSVQNDMTANSSSQRFLLSSLITNLYQDIERKDLKISNLVRQTSQMEEDWNLAIEEAKEKEYHNHQKQSPTRVRYDQTKIQALENLIEKLTVELENRTLLDRDNIEKVSQESILLRSELQRNISSVRDAEIRLRHAQATQLQSEDSRKRAEEEKLTLKETVLELRHTCESSRREKDEMVARLEIERREHNIQMEKLKASSLLSSSSSLPSSSTTARPDMNLDDSFQNLQKELAFAHSEIANSEDRNQSNLEIIEQLRLDARSAREDLTHSKEQVRELSIEMESSRLDSSSLIRELEDELNSAITDKERLEREIKIIGARSTSLEEEMNKLLEELRNKEEIIHLNSLFKKESHITQTQLVNSLTLLKSESNEKISNLQLAQEDLRVLLDDRDRRLIDTQKKLASQIASGEISRQELVRTKELVVLLRRESADREVRIVRLKKTRAELLEDKSGLEIALDAKQHEVTMWKRQVATARLPYLQEAIQPQPQSQPRSRPLLPRTATVVLPPPPPSQSNNNRKSSIPRNSSSSVKSNTHTPSKLYNNRGRQSPNNLPRPSTPSNLPVLIRRSSFGSGSGSTLSVRNKNEGLKDLVKENNLPLLKKRTAVRL